MAEIRELEPVGAYGLELLRTGDETSVHCRSDSLPLDMDFWWQRSWAVNDSGSLDCVGGFSYCLGWPTGASREEAIEIIRETGRQQPDSKYECIVDPDTGASISAMLLNPQQFDAIREVICDEENMSEIREGFDLEEVLVPGFDELSVETSALYLSWEGNEVVHPNGPEFSLIPAAGAAPTAPYIADLVKRTIATEHIDETGAALENLGAIFNQYHQLSPETLIS